MKMKCIVKKHNVCMSWTVNSYPHFGSQYFPFSFLNAVSIEVFSSNNRLIKWLMLLAFLQNVGKLQSPIPYHLSEVCSPFRLSLTALGAVTVLLYSMLQLYCLQPGFFFFSLSLTKCPRASIFCSLSVWPEKKFPVFWQNSKVLL